MIEHLNIGEPAYGPDSNAGSNAACARAEQRSEGLTRKLSNRVRAGYQTLRRKASSGNQRDRDASAGPVSRRRSDSRTSTATTFVSETDEPVPALPGMLNSSDSAPWDDTSSLVDPVTWEHRTEVDAPRVPEALVAGSSLIKATKKKRQEKIFSLDREGSKVTWQGAVSSKMFYVDDIRSIRSGLDAVSSWKDTVGGEVDAQCCFTVNYAPSQSSKETKTLHLLAPARASRVLWVKTLEALAKHREELMTEIMGSERDFVLRTHWDNEVGKRHDQDCTDTHAGLDLESITKLCRKLQIYCHKTVLESAFHVADIRKVGLLDFEQFRSFVDQIQFRKDIQPIFNRLKVQGINGINKGNFFTFLEIEQGVDILDSEIRKYWEVRFRNLALASNCATTEVGQDQYIDLARFTLFLLRDCHAYGAAPRPKPKLVRPLNEYFISSSHNTYLVGRQIRGVSSVEQYVAALRKGCRSVEIDCWDGENDEPKVTHGYTGTSSISFFDVIHAINKCAFDASSYPLILSLEVHCNAVQQLRMIQIMKEGITQDRLLLLPLAEHMDDLPSPEDLRYKILVKVKASDPHPNLSSQSNSTTISRAPSTHSTNRWPSTSVQSFSGQSTVSSGFTPFTSPGEISTDRSYSPTSEDGDQSEDSSSSPASSERPAGRPKTSKITPELAALGVYLQGYSYRMPTDLNFRKFNHIYSINENTAVDVAKHSEYKVVFEQHNMTNMCRVYPKAARVRSSNFDPSTFWRRGVQMVALNWQTYDIHMQMYQAMFAADTDATGYVLKPEYLRKPRPLTHFFDKRAKLPRHKITFSVKVISGHQLPILSTMGKPDLISPFVRIEMFSAEDRARGIASGHGGEEVSTPNSYHGIGIPFVKKTKVVRDNGFNPQFNDNITLALTTKYPELVFVRFTVCHAGKHPKELATFTAKLDSLQVGYRHLPLYNNNGEELIFSKLFCHFSKERPELIPASLADLQESPGRQKGNTLRRMLFSSERPVCDLQSRLDAQPQINREIRARRS